MPLLAALEEPDPSTAMPLLPPVRLTGTAVSLYWHSVDVQRHEFPIGSHHFVLCVYTEDEHQRLTMHAKRKTYSQLLGRG